MKPEHEHNYLAVVVVAFERVKSLQRLLHSLAAGIYDHPVQLIISIDKGNNQKVIDLANRFEWNFGVKEIICHRKNLGLKAHILHCGDLTNRFPGVIILEDDLLVSPTYYKYSETAIKFYASDDNVAGISLYSMQFNNQTKLPFSPLVDDADIFFIQLPSSWGQAWTRNQWQSFRHWYDKGQKIQPVDRLPQNILNWPETSWVKYFIKYLVFRNKYFVYPRDSLSTNFTEEGVHFTRVSEHYQVPMQLSNRSFRFKPLNESIVRYDAFFELERTAFDSFLPKLKSYDYIVDLNGIKPLDLFPNCYILTTRSCSNHIMNYGLKLFPFEMNPILGISGDDVVLAEKKDVQIGGSLSRRLSFFYGFLSGKKLLKLLLLRLKNKFAQK